LGTLGNTIAGAVGGVGGGQLLTALVPMLAGVGNNVDIAALASQAVGGGVAGAIVAAIVGVIKNKMASWRAGIEAKKGSVTLLAAYSRRVRSTAWDEYSAARTAKGLMSAWGHNRT
jgi:O-acetyl-ADP-ribose deacetylase (regulator of RNase III)